MATSIHKFWREEGGQAVVEYSLVMAFVAMLATALFLSSGGRLADVWSPIPAEPEAAKLSASS